MRALDSSYLKFLILNGQTFRLFLIARGECCSKSWWIPVKVYMYGEPGILSSPK